jgi:hypothetical protein
MYSISKISPILLGLTSAVLTPGVSAAVLLAIDFNERDDAGNAVAGSNAAGFQSFVLDSINGSGNEQLEPSIRTFGIYTVSVTGVEGTATGAGFDTSNGGLNDRQRNELVNSGSYTNALLHDDFIFSPDTSDGGIDLTFEGFTAGQIYSIELFSYDLVSQGTRVSDWSVNGVLQVNNYTFDGNVIPDDNSDYIINLTATADSSGLILVSGRRDATSVDTEIPGTPSPGVFLNAVRLSTVPEPSSAVLLGLGSLFLFRRKK